MNKLTVPSGPSRVCLGIIPMKRAVEAGEIAAAAVFLASDYAIPGIEPTEGPLPQGPILRRYVKSVLYAGYPHPLSAASTTPTVKVDTGRWASRSRGTPWCASG
jgi:hypothetical protein